MDSKNRRNWVTTYAEYRWDGERYVLVREEGYPYEGPWALATHDTSPTWTVQDFRFRNDNGSITSATWMDAINTTITSGIEPGTVFRLRINFAEEAGATIDNIGSWTLQYQVNSGATQSWTNVPTSGGSHVNMYDSTNLTNGTAIATGNFVLNGIGNSTAQAWGDENEDGVTPSQTWTDDYAEAEFCMQVAASGLSDGDVFDFRLTSPQGTNPTPTNLASFTLVVPADLNLTDVSDGALALTKQNVTVKFNRSFTATATQALALTKQNVTITFDKAVDATDSQALALTKQNVTVVRERVAHASYSPRWIEVATTGRIEKDGAITVQGGNGLTISGYVYFPDHDASYMVTSIRGGGTPLRTVQLLRNTSQQFQLIVYSSATAFFVRSTDASSIPTGVPIHFVLSYDADNGVFRCRINGSATGGNEGTGLATGTINWATAKDAAILADSDDGATPLPVGSRVSEIIIHDRFYDLTDASVLAKFWSGSIGSAVNHGSDGSAQLNEQPLAYFGYGDTASVWDAGTGNRGYSGAWSTITGSRTDAAVGGLTLTSTDPNVNAALNVTAGTASLTLTAATDTNVNAELNLLSTFAPKWVEVTSQGRIERDGSITTQGGGNGVTISGYFYFPAGSANNYKMALVRSTTGTTVFQLYHTADRRVRLIVYNSSSVAFLDRQTAANTLLDGVPYHVVVSFDADNGVFRCYVNGVDQNSGTGLTTDTMNWSSARDASIFGNSDTNAELCPVGTRNSEIIIHNRYYDLSDSAVLAKFWSGSVKRAVNHGSDGSAQIGEQPFAYFGYGDNAATWYGGSGNRGYSGSWAVYTGTYGDAVVGTLALARTNTNTDFDKNVTAGTASLTLTKQNSTVTFDKSVDAGNQALTLTKQNITVQYGLGVDAGTQALTLTKQNTTITFDKAVDAGNQALTLAKQNTTVTFDKAVTASATQALALTDTNTTVTFDKSVTAATSSLTLTATDAVATITAGSGSLALTKQNTTVTFDKQVTAGTQGLTLTDQNVTVEFDKPVIAGTDSLLLTKQNTTVTFDRAVTAGTESLTLTKQNTTATFDKQVTAGTQGLTLTDQNTTVTFDKAVTAGTASLTLTATDVGAAIAAGTDSLTLTKTNPNVNAALNVSAGTASLTLTDTNVAVTFDRSVAAGTGSLTLADQNTTVAFDKAVTAATDSLTLASQNVTATFDKNITAGTDSLSLSATNPTVDYEAGIDATTASLTLVTTNVSIGFVRNVLAATDSLVLAKTNVGVQLGDSLNVSAGYASLTLNKIASTVGFQFTYPADLDVLLDDFVIPVQTADNVIPVSVADKVVEV